MNIVACTYSYMYICMYVCLYIYICTYIYIYVLLLPPLQESPALRVWQQSAGTFVHADSFGTRSLSQGCQIMAKDIVLFSGFQEQSFATEDKTKTR